VKEGVELDRFYTYKYCSPTRSSFLSGRLPIHNTQINIGGGVHFVQMEEAGPEYFSGVDYRMTILPKKLKEGGYESYAIGKWHGGDASVHLTPKARGKTTRPRESTARRPLAAPGRQVRWSRVSICGETMGLRTGRTEPTQRSCTRTRRCAISARMTSALPCSCTWYGAHV
jgi:arylsulfatase A-like enzyme